MGAAKNLYLNYCSTFSHSFFMSVAFNPFQGMQYLLTQTNVGYGKVYSDNGDNEQAPNYYLHKNLRFGIEPRIIRTHKWIGNTTVPTAETLMPPNFENAGIVGLVER